MDDRFAAARTFLLTHARLLERVLFAEIGLAALRDAGCRGPASSSRTRP